jgi:hypothetical protein
MSPEQIDPDAWVDDAVSAVEFPAKAKGSLAWRRAFRAVLTRIHEQGRDGAAVKNLRAVANREEPRFDWTWAETVLPLLSSVSEERRGGCSIPLTPTENNRTRRRPPTPRVTNE